MTRENVKQVFVSIMVGACVAFFSTLFTELANFFQSHSTEIISAVSSAGVYLAKAYKG